MFILQIYISVKQIYLMSHFSSLKFYYISQKKYLETGFVFFILCNFFFICSLDFFFYFKENVLVNALQSPLQFLHLIICFIPCTCISLGDSSEFSGTPSLFVLYSTSCSSSISSISCICFWALFYLQLLFSAKPLCFLSLSDF